MKASSLRLEFAPGRRSGPVIGRYLLAVAIMLLAIELVPIGVAFTTRENDVTAFEAQAARPSNAATARAAQTKPDPTYIARVRSTKQVAKNLTMPWNELLDALESAPQESVALLAIEPSSAKKIFRITAEARNPQAMLHYFDGLRKDRRLDNVVLTSHQLQMQAPGRPIRFQLQAGWGAAP